MAPTVLEKPIGAESCPSPRMPDMASSALNRVLRKVGGPATLDLLTELPGADLTTLMLAVMDQRAGRLTGPDVLRRGLSDRFVAPSDAPFERLRAAESDLLSTLPDTFERVVLSPLAPLGLHSVLGPVHQNKVVSTARGSEVAADPTNGLALEAAIRRRESPDVVRLAALQRVVRAQHFGGRGMVPHFTLLGVVTAGRDTGNLAFEREHAGEQLRALTTAIKGRIAAPVELLITVLDPRFTVVLTAVEQAMPADVAVVEHPDRESGDGYYTGLCFKLVCRVDGERFELGDGGFVPWTQELIGNRKERLFISGLGVDRLALLG